ncbi:MAG TPA: hypothetical protein VFO77_09480 [Actinoplanes sp.]|nr:hypothetical protein [Actinoplanes sp.]
MTRDAVVQVLDICEQMLTLLRRLVTVALPAQQWQARGLRTQLDQSPVVLRDGHAPRAATRHDPGD